MLILDTRLDEIEKTTQHISNHTCRIDIHLDDVEGIVYTYEAQVEQISKTLEKDDNVMEGKNYRIDNNLERKNTNCHSILQPIHVDVNISSSSEFAEEYLGEDVNNSSSDGREDEESTD